MVLLDVDLIVDKQLVERLPMALEDDVHHRASSRFHVDPISHYTPLIPSTDMHRTRWDGAVRDHPPHHQGL